MSEAPVIEAHDLRVANAERLPYEESAFDLVYSWGVIHHAEHLENAFGEIFRVAKEGGRVKIMVYNFKALHSWFLYLRHGLLRGRPFVTRRQILFRHQESYGTKACRRAEILQLLSHYPHRNLRFYFFDQLIRDQARFRRPRRTIRAVTPATWRWYMAFEFEKR